MGSMSRRLLPRRLGEDRRLEQLAVVVEPNVGAPDPLAFGRPPGERAMLALARADQRSNEVAPLKPAAAPGRSAATAACAGVVPALAPKRVRAKVGTPRGRLSNARLETQALGDRGHGDGAA